MRTTGVRTRITEQPDKPMTYRGACNDAVQANAQVADGVTVAVENGIERRDRTRLGGFRLGTRWGTRLLARVPVCIAGEEEAAAVGAEVQVGG